MAGFIILNALPVSAAVFSGGNSYDLRGDQTINTNLYAAGGNVNLAGTVVGDVFTAGGSIMSGGKISNDLNAAGGNIIVTGQVGDDIRLTGGSINLAAKVDGEALIAGGQVQIAPEATINKDATISGGSVVLNGTINGNVLAYGQKVEIRGIINGNAKITTAELVLDPKTVIKGTLSYTAPTEIQIPSGAQIGKVNFTKQEMPTKNQGPSKALIGALWFYKLIAALIVAIIFFFIFKKGTTALVMGSLTKFWMKVLTGFATLILLPIAGIIVAITFVGIPFSAITALIYFLFICLSSIGAGVVFGTWIFSLFNKNAPSKYNVTWITIIIGILALGIIGLIPFIGWIIGFIFFLAVFGEIWILFYKGLVRIR